jgi:hypothetical protein
MCKKFEKKRHYLHESSHALQTAAGREGERERERERERYIYSETMYFRLGS